VVARSFEKSGKPAAPFKSPEQALLTAPRDARRRRCYALQQRRSGHRPEGR
jgi:hypothetical protein